jgi:hypothetical protein
LQLVSYWHRLLFMFLQNALKPLAPQNGLATFALLPKPE